MPGDRDRDKPKRFQTQNDRDLAGGKARRDSRPYGIPEMVEDDLTPPPQAPPTRDITAEMTDGERISMLEEMSRHNAQVMEREQKARREGEERGRQIGGLEEKIAAIASLGSATVNVIAVVNETVIPALRSMAGDLRALLEERQIESAQRKQVTESLDRLMREIGKLDERSQNTQVALALLSQRVDAMSQNVTDKIASIKDAHSERMDGIDSTLTAQIVELRHRVTEIESNLHKVDKTQAVSTALTRREKATMTGIGASIATAITWLVHHFVG